MRTVYIQWDSRSSQFDLPACYTAWRGFNLLCDDVHTFASLDDLPKDPSAIVFGGVLTVRNALKRLGIRPPLPLDYPEALRPFFERPISQTTLGQVRKAEGQEGFQPVFIKPIEHAKAFSGHVVRQFKDLIPTAHVPDDYPIWTSPEVTFLAEYRCFVLRGKVVGLRAYRGDPLLFPAATIVRAAVSAWKDQPVACSIDFGVMDNGLTAVVEVNDGFALGDMGLGSIIFARMIEARWDQMVEGRHA